MPKIAYKPGDLDADVAKAAGTLQVMTYPKGMKFSIEVDGTAGARKPHGRRMPTFRNASAHLSQPRVRDESARA